LGYAVEELNLSLQETALLLVDVYSAEPEHALTQMSGASRFAQVWHEVSVRNIGPALEAARSVGLPVIYVTNSAPRVATERSEFAAKLRMSLGFELKENFTEPTVDPLEYHEGPPAALQFPAEIRPQPGDHYVRKHVYSGFFDTRLDTLLRNLGIRTLLCVGFVADACLFTTIADALFRNYKVILLRDCTVASELPGDVEEMTHTNRMLLCIETIIGSTITSSEFLRACRELVEEARQ
jgi:ureidoacrylate peracid hydrolase